MLSMQKDTIWKLLGYDVCGIDHSLIDDIGGDIPHHHPAFGYLQSCIALSIQLEHFPSLKEGFEDCRAKLSQAIGVPIAGASKL